MKKFVLFLSSLFLCFALSFLAAKIPLPHFQLSQETQDHFFLEPRFSSVVHPIYLVLITNNEGGYLKEALDAVQEQKYANYHLLYVDDGSEDGSYDLALSAVLPNCSQIEMVRNEFPLGLVKNLENALRTIPKDGIVVILRAEERLSHAWALEMINRYYQDLDVWLTFSSAARPPFFERQEPKTFVTFYAHLLKGEPLADDFLQLLEEKAKGHALDLPDTLTVEATPL